MTSDSVGDHIDLISKDLSCQNNWISVIPVRFSRLLWGDPVQAQVRAPRMATIFSELVRVAHWDEGGQYFQIADREYPNPCEIILGTYVIAWGKTPVQEE